jgi:hypothetical protein
VLEEVSKSGSAGFLVLGTDVVPEIHMNYREFSILVQDDLQPVGKAILLELDIECLVT